MARVKTALGKETAGVMGALPDLAVNDAIIVAEQ